MYNLPETMTLNHHKKSKVLKRGSGRKGATAEAIVYQPSEFDILCGKDKRHARHNGNKVFRELIETNVFRYMMKDSKQDKMKITKEIVTTMRTKYNSRFLKSSGDTWTEITDQVARDKVSHALRFASKTKEEKRSVSQRRRKKSSHHRRSSSSTSYASTYSEATDASTVIGTPEVRCNLDKEANEPSMETLFHRQQQILTGLDNTVARATLPDFVVSHGDFNALRSADFDDLLTDPLFDDRELEAMQATATAL